VCHTRTRNFTFDEIEPWFNDVTYYRPFMHHDVPRISSTHEYCFSARSRTSHSCGKCSQTSTATPPLLQIIGIAKESPLLRLDTRLELRRTEESRVSYWIDPALKVRGVCLVHYATSNCQVAALKYDSVSRFFASILDGTANLSSSH